MIFKKMRIILISVYITFLTFNFSETLADNNEFKLWVTEFKEEAISSGISKNIVDDFMLNVKFLPKVIEYDRHQPEFYEDTFTYIKKRSSKRKLKEGLDLYNKEKSTIETI